MKNNFEKLIDFFVDENKQDKSSLTEKLYWPGWSSKVIEVRRLFDDDLPCGYAIKITDDNEKSYVRNYWSKGTLNEVCKDMIKHEIKYLKIHGDKQC